MPRTKGWVVAIILVSIFVLFAVKRRRDVTFNAPLIPSTTVTTAVIWEPFNRLTRTDQQALISALAHIQHGYRTYNTPDFDTPPLLVLQNCSLDNQKCGGVVERIVGLTNAFYFTLLWEGAAIASDDVSDFFDTSATTLPFKQAQVYVEKADEATIRVQKQMVSNDLSRQDYMWQYRNEKVGVVQTKEWDDWLAMRSNPSMLRPVNRYRLTYLGRSEWFWLVSRLMFSRPTPWLSGHLQPYLDLLGGHIRPSFSDSLSFGSPDNQVSATLADWFRVGVRWSGEEYADCVAAHITSVCAEAVAKECHVFLSTLSRADMDKLWVTLERHQGVLQPIVLHAVAESYPFTYGDDPSKNPESNKDRVKMELTRSWMDWMILSRMNYLIGSDNDTFLKTAAWAAQVRTDVIQSGTCNISELKDW